MSTVSVVDTSDNIETTSIVIFRVENAPKVVEIVTLNFQTEPKRLFWWFRWH